MLPACKHQLLHLIEFTDPCTFEGLTFKGGVGALITPGGYLAGGGVL